MTFYEQVQQAADYIRECTDLRPKTAVILGSGLGELAEHIQDAEIIPYREIPGFPVSHAKKMLYNVASYGVTVMMSPFLGMYIGPKFRMDHPNRSW